MGSHGATCAYTETSETEDIPLAAWNIRRYGQLCTTATSFAAMKAALEKLCHQTKNCKFEDQQKIAKFFDRIDKMNMKVKSFKSEPSPAPSDEEDESESSFASKPVKRTVFE